jgi:hypothetical protein
MGALRLMGPITVPTTWRVLTIILCGLGLLSAAPPARAEEAAIREGRSLGFSRLNERTARDTPMRFEQEAYRVFILQRLRTLGIRVVGGDDDPFARPSAGPELILGGVVRELDCKPMNGALNCRFGLEWQMFDVRTQHVIYQALVRGAEYDIRRDASSTDVGKQMLTQAIDSLVARPRFKKLLEPTESSNHEAAFPVSSFKRCTSGALDMPRQAGKATEATVMIELKGGAGSGFFLNDEGLILTAAHVVANADELRARLQDGRTFPVDVIRSAPSADVALLKVRSALKSSCLELAPTETAIGADVYAIGAPSGGQLAFSLTRGIVSGLRNWKGNTLLQTDAAINPGNSGGPLVGTDGRVKATVSAKLVGTAIEGLAFGVPAQSGLLALGLKADSTTAAELSVPAATTPTLGATRPFVDRADDVPTLDPAEDERRFRAASSLTQQHARVFAPQSQLGLARDASAPAPARPAAVAILRWGGVALATVGLVTALASSAGYDRSTSTKHDYEKLRLYNDLGFVGLAGGACSFAASFLIAPSTPNTSVAGGTVTAARSSMFIQVRGSY